MPERLGDEWDSQAPEEVVDVIIATSASVAPDNGRAASCTCGLGVLLLVRAAAITLFYGHHPAI